MQSKVADQEHQMVGIFWLIEDRLVLDTSLLNIAEPYGECLTHGKSHIDYWTEQQGLATVPQDIEYEEYPRGRVVYNTRAEKFYLLADRCILKDKSQVTKIKKAMHLPSNTTIDTDPHYRCSQCLRGHTPIDDADANF